MSARDDQLVRLRGFPAGVHNVAPAEQLPADDNGVPIALTEAVNVDLVGPRRTPRVRDGYTRAATGAHHSPAALGDRLLVVEAGALVMRDLDLAPAGVLRAGVGPRYVSYAPVGDDLYWSNGLEIRRVRGADFADLPVWIDAPGVPEVEALPDGGLDAGTYRVAMTWFDVDGRESGAVGLAEVELSAGQGLRVHAIPAAPEGAYRARVYVSPPNGEELYAAVDLHPSTAQTAITAAQMGEGRALETLWRQPLPPCEILRYWNGRLLGAAGNLLVWSDALRVGLTTTDAYMRFGQVITLLEPLGEGEELSGCWVADHKNTYWMAGAAPASWRRVIRYDHPAVPGTSLVVRGSHVGLETEARVAVWLATNGVLIAGLPDGSVRPLTEGRLALPEGERGAALFREHDGLRQLITSYITSNRNGLAVGDSAVASVTRHP